MSSPKKGKPIVKVFHRIARSASEKLPGQLTPEQAKKYLRPLRQPEPHKPAEDGGSKSEG